jgi:hypothetical protein
MQGGTTAAVGGGGATAAADDDDDTDNKQGITLDERSASSRHDRASRSLSLSERRESNRLGERQGSSSLGASGSGGGVGRLASSLSSNPTPAVLVRDGSRRSLPSPAVVPFRFEISTGSGSSSASDHSGEEDFTRSLSQRGVPLSAPLAPVSSSAAWLLIRESSFQSVRVFILRFPLPLIIPLGSSSISVCQGRFDNNPETLTHVKNSAALLVSVPITCCFPLPLIIPMSIIDCV